MEVRATGPSEVTIIGDIRTIPDYIEIKKVLRKMVDDGQKTLQVKIPDSPSINSALIGLLLRLIHEDRVQLSLHVRNDNLLKMLEVMNLQDIFNVTTGKGE